MMDTPNKMRDLLQPMILNILSVKTLMATTRTQAVENGRRFESVHTAAAAAAAALRTRIGPPAAQRHRSSPTRQHSPCLDRGTLTVTLGSTDDVLDVNNQLPGYSEASRGGRASAQSQCGGVGIFVVCVRRL